MSDGDWFVMFALFPVHTDDGGLVWLKDVWARWDEQKHERTWIDFSGYSGTEYEGGFRYRCRLEP